MGRKEDIDKYLSRLTEAVHIENIRESEKCVRTLMKLVSSALGESGEAKSLKEFAEKKEKEKEEKIEEAGKESTTYKRNLKKAKARLEYAEEMQIKLLEVADDLT